MAAARATDKQLPQKCFVGALLGWAEIKRSQSVAPIKIYIYVTKGAIINDIRAI